MIALYRDVNILEYEFGENEMRRKAGEKDRIVFNVRLEKELWTFIKHRAIDNKTTLNSLILSLILEYKRKYEKKMFKGIDIP